MSDGPFKSLNMNRAWKGVGFRAERPAFSADEVAKQVKIALAKDLSRGIPKAILKAAESVFKNEEPSLFGVSPAEFDKLHSAAMGSTIGSLFVEQCQQAASQGLNGSAGYEESVHRTIEEIADRRGRQICEHYLRVGSKELAQKVVASVQSSVAAITATLTREITGVSTKVSRPSSAKMTSLDDGVPLYE